MIQYTHNWWHPGRELIKYNRKKNSKVGNQEYGIGIIADSNLKDEKSHYVLGKH